MALVSAPPALIIVLLAAAQPTVGHAFQPTSFIQTFSHARSDATWVMVIFNQATNATRVLLVA